MPLPLLGALRRASLRRLPYHKMLSTSRRGCCLGFRQLRRSLRLGDVAFGLRALVSWSSGGGSQCGLRAQRRNVETVSGCCLANGFKDPCVGLCLANAFAGTPVVGNVRTRSKGVSTARSAGCGAPHGEAKSAEVCIRRLRVRERLRPQHPKTLEHPRGGAPAG